MTECVGECQGKAAVIERLHHALAPFFNRSLPYFFLEKNMLHLCKQRERRKKNVTIVKTNVADVLLVLQFPVTIFN